MIYGFYAKSTRVLAAEVQPENEAALAALVGGWANAADSESETDQRMMTQRMPPEANEPLTGVIIPSILPDGSFYREPDGRVREFGRDFYAGAVIVRHENGSLDGYATVDEFLAAYPVRGL